MRMKYVALAMLFGAMPILTTGCAAALVGAGAAGTYAMVQGSAEGFSDAGYNRIWKRAKKVLEKIGTVVSEDKQGGALKAKVDGANVAVELTKITGATTKMKITARKKLIPNEQLAQEIYNEVSKGL